MLAIIVLGLALDLAMFHNTNKTNSLNKEIILIIRRELRVIVRECMNMCLL